MTTIWYNDIENVSLSLTDPNTWWAVSNVPWVSSPKINAWTSVYNEQWWWDGVLMLNGHHITEVSLGVQEV